MLPTNKDVKNLNQCSRRLYSLCLPRLWNHARLHWSIEGDKDFLHEISHLPIHEIHLDSFSPSLDFNDIQQVLPQLKLIHLDLDSYCRTITPNELHQFKIPFVVMVLQ